MELLKLFNPIVFALPSSFGHHNTKTSGKLPKSKFLVKWGSFNDLVQGSTEGYASVQSVGKIHKWWCSTQVQYGCKLEGSIREVQNFEGTLFVDV